MEIADFSLICCSSSRAGKRNWAGDRNWRCRHRHHRDRDFGHRRNGKTSGFEVMSESSVPASELAGDMWKDVVPIFKQSPTLGERRPWYAIYAMLQREGHTHTTAAPTKR